MLFTLFFCQKICKTPHSLYIFATNQDSFYEDATMFIDSMLKELSSKRRIMPPTGDAIPFRHVLWHLNFPKASHCKPSDNQGNNRNFIPRIHSCFRLRSPLLLLSPQRQYPLQLAPDIRIASGTDTSHRHSNTQHAEFFNSVRRIMCENDFFIHP